ncbi:MAG: CAP domain-containing protein [Gaiellaceae bacterium]
MRLLVLIASALAAVSASVFALPANGQDVRLERRATLEQEVLVELNRTREARGLKPLRVTSGLRSSAVTHSRAMVQHGFFSHTSADGTPFNDRIRRHYVSRGWGTWSVGETLLTSSGATDARSIVAAWLRSAPHREIVLSAAWRDAGIGILYRSSAPGTFAGSPALVVTADFGLRESRVVRARAAR